jgi:hypothetical protein
MRSIFDLSSPVIIEFFLFDVCVCLAWFRAD